MKNRSILFQADIELMRGDTASIQIVYNKLTSQNVTGAYLELMQAMFKIELIVPSQLVSSTDVENILTWPWDTYI